jgi:hypothetical protein
LREPPALDHKVQQVKTMAVPKRIRRPLGDMGHFLCPLLGTCLAYKELQKIARSFKYQGETTPYNLHTWLINACQKAPAVAKYVQKYLTGKYRVTMKLIDEFEAKDLEQAWDEAVRDGQVAGAFWAIMTRLDMTPEIIERVFGEVHMMSHLQGSEVRAELKKMKSLTLENLHLQDRVQKLTARLEGVRERRDELARTLSGLKLKFTQLQRQLARAEKTLQSHAAGEVLQGLHHEAELLRDQLAGEQRLREKLERQLENFRAPAPETILPCRLAVAAEGGTGDLDLPEMDCPLARGEPCPKACNLNILFVGGLDRLTPHYRSLVEEEFGATFSRHDGNLRNGKARLTGMVQKADIVLCPISVNSHLACLCAKKFCKRLNKPCLMLRKASLGTVEQALRQLAAGKLPHQAVQELAPVQGGPQG